MSFTERLALVISARADQALKEIRKVTGETGQLGQQFGDTGTKAAGLGSTMKAGLVAGAAAGGAALTALASNAVNAASDLGEQVSATEQIFGDASDAILDFGKTAADSLGISNRAALEASNQFGDLFQNIGVSQGNAAAFSQQLVRLAADLASFKNLAPEDVLQRLQSGLVGETEPLRRLGVVINEAAVKSKAMELGIAGVSGEVSEGAKVQARYALILEKTTRAQGDVARTSESLANQQRRTNAQMEDANAKIGRVLIPLYQQVAIATSQLVSGVEKTNDSFIRNFPLISKVGEKLGLLKKDGLDPATVAYEQLSKEVAQEAAASASQAEQEKRTADALSDSAAAAKGYADTVQSMLEATERTADAERSHADASRGFNAAIQGIADAERELADARQDRTSAARDAIAAERQLNSIEDATKGVADAERELAKAREGRGNTARAIADAEKAVAEAQRDLNRSGGGQAGTDRRQAVERLAEARERLAEVQSEGGGREHDIAEATEALSRAQLDAREASVALAEANQQRAERERRAAERVTKAEGDLAGAKRNAQSAAIDLARSTQELVEWQAAALGQPLSAAEKYSVYRNELIKLKDQTAPGSDLRRNLEALINKLPPPEVKFALIADTAQADAALEKLRQQWLAFNQANPGAVGPSLFGPVGSPQAAQPAPNVTIAPGAIQINASDMPTQAALDQMTSTLGWTLARITRR